MSYLPNIAIHGSDDGTIDAFARMRMSIPYTLFDSKQIFDSGSIFWAQSGSSGGYATWSKNRASTTLYVSNSLNSEFVRQTKQRFNYEPGKSQLIMLTGVLGDDGAGISKKLGYFDTSNGLFFEYSGSVLYVAIRSNVSGTPTDMKVAQADWNIDKMDGTGPSKIILNISNAQIFTIDFEWLGAGRARFGFVMNGKVYYVHAFLNANVISSVYMSTPNLPLRYSIKNLTGAGTGSLEQICSTVMSEGGVNPNGIVRTIGTNITGSVSLLNNQYTSIVSIRIKSEYKGASVKLQSIAIQSDSNVSEAWSVLYNPTKTGATDIWINISGSALEYSIVAGSLISNEGVKIASGYIANTSRADVSNIDSPLTLGEDLDGNRDIITLAALPTANRQYSGVITVRELL